MTATWARAQVRRSSYQRLALCSKIPDVLPRSGYRRER